MDKHKFKTPIRPTSRTKQGARYKNFRFHQMSSTDLLSVCEQKTPEVSDTEINLYCTESDLSLEDIWDELSSPKTKESTTTTRTTTQEIHTRTSRNVPPNSPVYPITTHEGSENPFINCLLKIWSEQRFNSPQVDIESDAATSQHEGDGAQSREANPALVFQDLGVEQSVAECVEQVNREQMGIDHVVPAFEENQSYFEQSEDNSERVLASCVPEDHLVPVFIEE
ncbi:uncharacterized protein [Haliotis cracherodii]|uniref:uncharacterized protein n=1 Tax=Haliotis cracherodii TaxID=6455 RepID=UPI0039EBD8B8